MRLGETLARELSGKMLPGVLIGVLLFELTAKFDIKSDLGFFTGHRHAEFNPLKSFDVFIVAMGRWIERNDFEGDLRR